MGLSTGRGSWLRSEPSLKIASVVLALFVWMYVRSEEKPVQGFSVPLELDGLPAHLSLVGETPDSVYVRVRATESVLRNLSPGRIHARLKLDGAKPGELSLPVTPGDVRVPRNVEVLRVDPQRITLRAEPRVTREVPVVARLKGQPAAGFEHDGYVLTPDRVTIEGPEGFVAQVREAVTDEVDLGNRRESFEIRVGIVPERGGVRLAGQTEARLRVNIREQRVTRSFAGIPLAPSFSEGVEYRVEFEPRIVTVVLEGTREVLDKVAVENIRAYLDLEGMSPRSASFAVKPRVVVTPGDLASKVAVHSISEPTINVRLKK